jgi:hypothetical protein
MNGAPVLILPGLYNSGSDHWQSRWESAHSEFRRVMQDDCERPRCADWVARLEAAVRTPLLVAPSDPEAASYPAGPTRFDPMPPAGFALLRELRR